MFSTYINGSSNLTVQQSEESHKWENPEPRQLLSTFPCFSRRRFLPWRRLPSTSPNRDGGAGQGPLARGRPPEAWSGAGNPPSLLFPFNAFAALLKDLCPSRRGLSLLRVIHLAVQGELLPVTAAVLRCLPSPPRRRVQAAAKECHPAAGSGCGERQQQRVQNKKIKSKKTVCGRGEDGGRLQLEPLAATQRPSF